MSAQDRVFTGRVPEIYERYLVPLIFEAYADDIAERLAARKPKRVLEIAAGTGVVTRRLASALPDATIVATDLNQGMLDEAIRVGTSRPVEWRQADALQLPFPDGSFDAVVCQFGVMFFPDRTKAYAEARRVLRQGGVFIFNAWDRIEANEFADLVTRGAASLFPSDPPRFLARTPYGYHDEERIRQDVKAAGFAQPSIELIAKRSRAPSYRDPAIGFAQGTPLRGEIEARDPSRLAEATDAGAEEVAKRFGRGAVDGKMQARVVTVER